MVLSPTPAVGRLAERDCPDPPPITGGRNLIVCCDGTSNTEERAWITNVVRLYRGLADLDARGEGQVRFYDRGVGTRGWFDNVTGGAFGIGLQKNVEEAYLFLVKNYVPGDRIYLFGFSRGAFTARSVAGFIRQCSILKPENEDEVHRGYRMYRSSKVKPDDDEAEKFRQQYSHPTPLIEFVGVWDTVGALGIPANRICEWIKQKTVYRVFGRPKQSKSETPNRPLWFLSLPRSRHAFHDVTLTGRVKNAYHALAIDEKRPVFTPSVWQSQPKMYELDGVEYCQQVHQSWFAGDHSDVGGGNSHAANSLLSLEWIARAAEGAGIKFKKEFWDTTCEAASHTGPLSSSPPESWRRFGSELRDMSEGPSKTECIHPSVRLRQKDTGQSYNPQNLADSPLPDCR